MKENEIFEITKSHLELLRKAYVRWEDCEYGAPAIDCKRPYGNSNVEGDIAEILEWRFDKEEGLSKEQSELARKIHEETETVLQICLHLQKFEVGKYKLKTMYSNNWVKI